MDRERSSWDQLYQELKQLVRPDTADFFSGSGRPLDSRRQIYDGTAPWSLEQLSSGLHSYLSSPVDRYFTLGVSGIPTQQLSFQEKAWLEETSDTIYAHYSNPFSSFNPSMHEVYMDLGAFGTACLYQWLDPKTRALMFRAYPLASIRIMENADGVVDTVHRTIRWTIRQVEQEFGYLTEKLSKMEKHETVTVLHCVYPRADHVPGSRSPTKRAFVSAYVCVDTKETLREGGYDWMPYATPRWTKLAGEVHGRSPALSVFPEIRMVNAMSKTLIVAAEKIVNPPLIVPDDGFLLPLKTGPNGLNYKRPGYENIETMPVPARIDIGIEMIEQRRETIRRGFYVDWIVRPTKKERQTAQEIMDDRNQMLSMMGPIVGRQHAELIGPTIGLSFHLLQRAHLLKPMPASLNGANLDLVYISPAAKAQSTTADRVCRPTSASSPS